MRNTIIPIALFLCTLFAACNGSSTKQETSKTINAEGAIITDYPGGNGLQKSETKNQQGQVSEEGDLLNGQKEGTWVTYFSSGLVASVTSYRNGKKHGFAMKADETGSITEKMVFVNDQLEGKRILFNHTRIKEEDNFIDGKLEGERKLYYDDGKIQEEGNFKNGKRDGVAKWYDQEGNVKIQYTYKNGEQVE